MAIGHLKSCECSECAADRAARVTSGAELPAAAVDRDRRIADDFEEIKTGTRAASTARSTDTATHNAILRDILAVSGTDVIAEIAASPMYVICVNGVPRIAILGGDGEFALKAIGGNVVFNTADDDGVPPGEVQVFAVALRGASEVVFALNAETAAAVSMERPQYSKLGKGPL